MKIHILRHDDNETPHLTREDAIAELRRPYDDPGFSEMPTQHEVGTDDWLADVAEFHNVVVYITEHDLGPMEVLITGHPGTGFNFYGPFPKDQSWDFASYFDFAFSDELMDVSEATGTTYVLNEDNKLEPDAGEPGRDWHLDDKSRPGWPRWVTAQHLLADLDHPVEGGEDADDCHREGCGLATLDGKRHGRGAWPGDTAADQDYNGGQEEPPITERINQLGFPVNKLRWLKDEAREELARVGMLTVTRALSERLSDTDDEYRIVGLVSSERNAVIHEPMIVRYTDEWTVDLLCRLRRPGGAAGDYQVATWEIPKLFRAMSSDTSADAIGSTVFDDAHDAVLDFTKGS